MDLDDATAQRSLNEAIGTEDEKQLYGYSAGKVYVFQPHLDGVYHGYPATQWGNVPSKILQEMLQSGIIDRDVYNQLTRKVGGR